MFEIIDWSAQARESNLTIYRDFALRIWACRAKRLGIRPEDVDKDGVFEGEHELKVFVDATYVPSEFRGNAMQPPDPDELIVRSWSIVAIDRLDLSDVDAKRLKGLLKTELTEAEEQVLFDLLAGC